jgi:DNA-3-methyladenine glycosylase II
MRLTMAAETTTIEPQGPFSLRAAAGFGFGPNEGAPPPFHGVMRLAFAVDGGRGYAGAELRQDGDDAPVTVALSLSDGATAAPALAQVARTLSLDHDGRAFIAVADRDPVIGELQRAHPGQRPVLFYSPYEAAAWGIISARRPAGQGARVRDELAASLGQTFELAGQTVGAFPQPEALAEIGDDVPGLNAAKVQRLRALAQSALAGDLDVARIHALGPEAAHVALQELAGIGPFYAALIVLRASGFADAWLAGFTHRGLDHATVYYGLGADPSAEQLTEISDRWRPFRTWCQVLIRLAGERGTRLA